MTVDQMAVDYERDHAAKRRMETAASALDSLLENPHRVPPAAQEDARELRDLLRSYCAHIVAVWD